MNWLRDLILRWRRYNACRHPEYCSGVAHCDYCHGHLLDGDSGQ